MGHPAVRKLTSMIRPKCQMWSLCWPLQLSLDTWLTQGLARQAKVAEGTTGSSLLQLLIPERNKLALLSVPLQQLPSWLVAVMPASHEQSCSQLLCYQAFMTQLGQRTNDSLLCRSSCSPGGNLTAEGLGG